MSSSSVARRVVKSAVLLCLIGVLLASNMPFVKADDNPSRLVSWAGVTPVARYRNHGDWLVDVGRAKPADIYGPFSSKAYQEGDTEQFFALDFERTTFPRRINATLRLVTDHAYWWFEEGTDADQADIDAAGHQFETEVYPLDHMLFGEEWNPGIDNDPRIFILHQKKIGGYAVGVFSPKDECPRRVCPSSNQREMIYIGLDYAPPQSAQHMTVIAHEFQHLIQYNSDGNEERWLDEGLAQLAEHLNGFNPRNIANSNLRDFLHEPNFQLDSWPIRADQDPGVNYAASYIFCVYLYQRFGTAFIQHLARSPYKGLASVDETLRAMNTGTTLDEVFADWAVTNYVNSPYVDDGRFYYQSLKLPQRADSTELRPGATKNGSLHEYGAEYLQVRGAGTYTLSFTGDTTVPLTNTAPASGDWMWWSFNAERGAARLEREVDLTNADNPEMTFNARWDLPNDYGWAQILVSADGGKKWDIVRATDTRSCRFVDSAACYTGSSKGWKEQTVDLNAYAGKKIGIRFEYINEGVRQGDGFFIDDISIPAGNFTDDAETDVAGWKRQGFMRITKDVPQHWSVNVITRSTPPKVLPVKLDANNAGKLKFTAPDDGAIVVVSAMAPFVESKSDYTVSVRKN